MSLGVRHASRRQKARLRGFPTRDSMLKTALDIIILPIAFIAPLALLPQIFQLYLTHDVSSISVVSWLSMVAFDVVWLYYGIVHKDKPIIITNIMYGVFNLLVALGAILFR